MDVDFWNSSDHLVKHVSAPASEEDEAREFFPCPFCYVEIELSMFCTHLQEEHCFDLRNAVCPLCAENLGKNPVEHFTMRHTPSIKRRRKSQNFGIWGTEQPGQGKELRDNDISSYLVSASKNKKDGRHEADPLLSPFLFHTPQRNSNDNLHNKEITFISIESTRAKDNAKRNTMKPEEESEKQDNEEKRKRTVFVEDLVMSTIF